MANHSDFVSRARTLMDDVVSIANRMGNVQSELMYSDIASTLTDEDCIGENAGLTAAEVLGALQALGEVIAGMSSDGKRAIYAIKN